MKRWWDGDVIAGLGRFSGDRGAVIPEFALVAPVLILFMLGVLEFGWAWRQTTDIESAVRGAVRQAANLGDARSADYFALQSYWAGMAKTKNITVERVVIYKTLSSNGDPINSSCFTQSTSGSGSGISNSCNIYGRLQLQTMLPSNFNNLTGSSCSGSAWDRFWCPTARNADQGDPPDYLGVFTRVTYDTVTNIYGSSLTIEDRAVMRIEPKVSQP